MTDKVHKIKEWIGKEQDGLMDTQGNFEYPEHEGAYHILCNLDAYIDSLQEEPVSIDFEQELYKAFGQVKDFTLGMRIAKWFYDMGKNSQEPVSEDLKEFEVEYIEREKDNIVCIYDRHAGLVDGAKWQKQQMIANTADAMIGLPYENKDGGYTHLIDVSRPLPVGNNKIAIIFKED